MLFRRWGIAVASLTVLLAGCSPAVLPESISPDPADPTAPTAAMPYQPVLSGTAAYVPVELKPWRELNDEVAPGGGRSR